MIHPQLREDLPTGRHRSLVPVSTHASHPLSPSITSQTPFPRIVVDANVTPECLKHSVMLLGNYDCFHRGHQALLTVAKVRAAEAGLPLGIMSTEPHPRQLFAPQDAPFRLTTCSTKWANFARLGFDFVFSPIFDHTFARQSAEAFVERSLIGGLSVAHVVVGHDFRFGAKRGGDCALLGRMGRELGFGVSRVDEISHHGVTCSSSQVRDFLRAGDIAGANIVLGYRWSVEIRLANCGAPRSGRWSVGWPDHVLRPAPGRYPVAVRGFAGTASIALGEIAIGNSGDTGFTITAGRMPLNAVSAASPVLVEFISSATSHG